MVAVGGPGAVLLHPTQFTSMIVLCQATSILFPLVMSGLHLALNNPYLILSGLEARRSVVCLLCLLGAAFTPILMINAYEAAQERLRIMVNKKDKRVPRMIRICMELKNQLTEFLKIELGKHDDKLLCTKLHIM